MWGDLHESKEILLRLPGTVTAGTGNRVFRELGAKLDYDVYSFEATHFEQWQSESLLDVSLFRSGEEVDAQEDFDEIRLVYLFASRPSSDQHIAVQKIVEISSAFHAEASYQGKALDPTELQIDWDSCNDFLLKEWGEEPGSKSLAIMIEQNYT